MIFEMGTSWPPHITLFAILEALIDGWFVATKKIRMKYPCCFAFWTKFIFCSEEKTLSKIMFCRSFKQCSRHSSQNWAALSTASGEFQFPNYIIEIDVNGILQPFVPKNFRSYGCFARTIRPCNNYEYGAMLCCFRSHFSGLLVLLFLIHRKIALLPWRLLCERPRRLHSLFEQAFHRKVRLDQSICTNWCLFLLSWTPPNGEILFTNICFSEILANKIVFVIEKNGYVMCCEISSPTKSGFLFFHFANCL